MKIELSSRLRRLLLLCVFAACNQAASVHAKPGNPEAAPSPKKQQRQAEQLKLILGASDAEWQVLAPKVERILTLQHERERFIGKPKLPKPPNNDEAGRAVTPTTGALPTIDIKPESKKDSAQATTPNGDVARLYSRLISMASDEHIGPGELTSALRDFRTAQAKSDAELAKARNELRDLVTVKQEIILVLMKILD